MPFELFSYFFFFNDTATTEIYTLSLHDALPISRNWESMVSTFCQAGGIIIRTARKRSTPPASRISSMLSMLEILRSEEHTSELQSRPHLVCRLLLEKKKKIYNLTD